MPNEQMAIRTELRLVPTASAFRRFLIVAFSSVRTAKMPMMERMIPTAAINIGAMTALYCATMSPLATKAAAPRAAVARIDPQ